MKLLTIHSSLILASRVICLNKAEPCLTTTHTHTHTHTHECRPLNGASVMFLSFHSAVLGVYVSPMNIGAFIPDSHFLYFHFPRFAFNTRFCWAEHWFFFPCFFPL